MNKNKESKVKKWSEEDMWITCKVLIGYALSFALGVLVAGLLQ